MKISPGLSSHFPLLINSFMHTSGDVLELGMGLYSTPLLHWLCADTGRRLVSYENDPKYMKLNDAFAGVNHSVNFIENWDDARIEKKWGLAFIDHAPADRRAADVIRLADLAQIIVVHDTEPRREGYYQYSRMYKYFRYRYDYLKSRPNTSALSNFNSLDFLYETFGHSPKL